MFPVNLTIFPTEKAVARRAHKSDLQSVNMSPSSSDIGPNQVTGSLGRYPGLCRAVLARSDVFPVNLNPVVEGLQKPFVVYGEAESRESGALRDRFRCANMIITYPLVEPTTAGVHRSRTSDLASTAH